MNLRPAQPGDAGPLSGLFREVADLHAELLPGFFRKAAGNALPVEAIERILRSPHESILVAEEQGAIVGLVHVQIHETPPLPIMTPRRRAHIDNIVVARTMRRRGLGRLLMDAASSWARDRGADEIVLTVWAGNDEAERFYEALGFHRVNQVLGRSL